MLLIIIKIINYRRLCGSLPLGRAEAALPRPVQDVLHHSPHPQAGKDLPSGRTGVRYSEGHGHRRQVRECRECYQMF